MMIPTLLLSWLPLLLKTRDEAPCARHVKTLDEDPTANFFQRAKKRWRSSRSLCVASSSHHLLHIYPPRQQIPDSVSRSAIRPSSSDQRLPPARSLTRSDYDRHPRSSPVPPSLLVARHQADSLFRILCILRLLLFLIKEVHDQKSMWIQHRS